MSHNNHIAQTEIVLTIKKIEVLRPITFRGCSISQETQNAIKIFGLKTFKGYNTPQIIQKSNF